MMRIPISVVDAFATGPFCGNPAAICLLPGPVSSAWMQQLAAEMNLSETAFLVPESGDWNLRWFTPRREVDLCGHATLASAHFLWSSRRLAARSPAAFNTRSGRLTAEREGEWIRLDFPATPVEEAPPIPGLLATIRTEALWTGRSRFDAFIEVSSETAVRRIQPDFQALARLPVRGVIVTARSDLSDYDFVSRFFAPAVGVPEDPVTGSAHCALAGYWAKRLNRSHLVGWQASERGGEVRVTDRGDRVYLSGRAVTIWQGSITRWANPPSPCHL